MLVLADDLTGAVEAGAILAGFGIAGLVTTELTLDPGGLIEADDVLVVDTESRHLPPSEAAERVRRLAADAMRLGIGCLYKKTDSTLRGNIGAELGALLAASSRPLLVYVPAYPGQGRVCRGGRLYVRGRLLEHTEFAKDALSPVAESSVSAVLAAQTDVPVRVVETPQDLKRMIRAEGGPAIYVCDGETDADLAACARALRDLDMLHLTAGPAAFVRHLAPLLDLPRRLPAGPPFARTSLTVCGSLRATSLRQVRHALARGFAAVRLAPEEVLAEGPPGPALVEQVLKAIKTRGHVVLHTVSAAAELSAYASCARRLGVAEAGLRTHVREGLGRITRGLLEACAPDALIVFGGDTLFGIMEACGPPAIRPAGEALPGVPVSRVQFGERQLTLVSKAGDFGPANVLAVIRDFLAPAD